MFDKIKVPLLKLKELITLKDCILLICSGKVLANSFPEQINNLPSGERQLVGTDTRSFTNITTANYTIPLTISNNKPVMVECVVHSGSIVTVSSSMSEDSAFLVGADGDIVNFDDIRGVLTLPKDVSGYRMYFPTMTRISQDLTEKYWFYTIQGVGTVYPMLSILSDGITITFVNNNVATFTGTVTFNIYQ